MAGVEENSRQLLQEILLKTFTKCLNPKDPEHYFLLVFFFPFSIASSLLGILVKESIAAPAFLVSY